MQVLKNNNKILIDTALQKASVEVNELFEDARIEIEDDFILMGENSTVDSLTLVSFFVSIEDKLNIEASGTITLVSEDSFTREDRPFHSIGSLKSYLMELMDA